MNLLCSLSERPCAATQVASAIDMHQIDFDIAALLYHRLVIGPTTRTLAGYQIQGIKGRIREDQLKAFRRRIESGYNLLGHRNVLGQRC
jgi:hypothetical protein